MEFPFKITYCLLKDGGRMGVTQVAGHTIMGEICAEIALAMHILHERPLLREDYQTSTKSHLFRM